MLMNHKNFHFTQIPDKTNDMIFLKNPKTLFLGHFWSFLPDGDFFPKNPAMSHIMLHMSNTMLSFRKDLWANSEKTYGQTEGRTDGRNLVYRTLPTEARGPITLVLKKIVFIS